MAARLTNKTVAEEARSAVSKDGPQARTVQAAHGSRRALRALLTMETFARSRVFRCFGDSLRALPATDIAGDVIGGRERLSRR